LAEASGLPRLTVDLTIRATIHVELLTDQAFYFFGKERGAGGLPTGTAGRVVCLLSGGIDSPVAAHRMMKRGCTVTFVHFHSYPILSRASQEKAASSCPADGWQQRSRCISCLRRDPAAGRPGRRAAAARRHLPAPDDADCRGHRAPASRGCARDRRSGRAGRISDARESCGDQRRRDAARAAAAHRHGQDEITAEAIAWNLSLSIIPDQDCCTLFTPRNPLTRARLADIEAAEQALPIDDLVDRAVREAVIELAQFPVVGSKVNEGV
jgi:thiamine biosynthesis protein ThiI